MSADIIAFPLRAGAPLVNLAPAVQLGRERCVADVRRDIALYQSKLEGRWVRCRLTGREGHARGMAIKNGVACAMVWRGTQYSPIAIRHLDISPRPAA